MCVSQPLSNCTVQPCQSEKESFSLLDIHLLLLKEADKWHASGLLQKVLVLCSVCCEHNILLGMDRWCVILLFVFLSLKLSRGGRRGKNDWIWWGQTYCWGQGIQNSEIPRCGIFSCHSESSDILRIQDELVTHPYCLVHSRWLNRQSHSRDRWGGLMV